MKKQKTIQLTAKQLYDVEKNPIGRQRLAEGTTLNSLTGSTAKRLYDVAKKPLSGLILLLLIITHQSYAGWVISSGTNVNITSGASINTSGNLTIQNGGLLTNEGSISLTGNLLNHEPSFLGDGTFDFIGSVAQEIGGSEVSGFGDLKISNLVNLQNDITINNELLFNGDKISLGSFGMQLFSGAQISGIDAATAYIVSDNTGTLTQEVGTSPVLFPVGSSGFYSPITLNNDGTLDNYHVRVFSDVIDNGTSGTTIPEIDKCVNKTWVLEEDVIGGSDIDLTTQWNATDEGSSFTRINSAISHYSGNWISNPESPASGSDPYSQVLSGVSELGAFAVFSGFTAPITTISTLTEQCHNSTISVPVTVTNFNNVGGISLVMDFDETLLSLSGVSWNAAIVGGQHLEPIPGKITFSWISTTGVNISDNETLFTLDFNYIGVDPNPTPATTALTWDNSDPAYLEYATPDGTVLTDDPFVDYYFDGSIEIKDITLPEITCPTVDPFYLVNDVCTWIASGLEPVISDNCSVEPQLELYYSVDNGNNWTAGNANAYAFAIGDTEVIYKVVDEALNESTCTLSVHVDGITVSGAVDYYNTALTSMDDDVTVILQQGGSDILTTNTIAGVYTFDDVCLGTYDIVVSTSKDNGGINTTDAAQVNYWSVNNSELQAVRFYAGDVVDTDLSLLSNDAGLIQQYFLTFGNPDPLFTSNWTFWNVDEMVSTNPGAGGYPQITVTNATASMTNDMYAMVTGDFNSSFIPGAKAPESGSIMLTYGDIIEVGAEEFELPIYAGMDMDIGAISLILNIPSELLEVHDVYMGDEPVQYMIDSDQLRISWLSLNPVSIQKGETMLTLLMSLNGDPGEEGIKLSLVGDPLNELADDTYSVIDNAELMVDIIMATFTGVNPLNATGELELASYPNPFKETTNLTYTLPTNGRVILEVYNLLGNKIKTVVDEMQNRGEYQVKFDANILQPGVYTALLRLETNDDVLTQTIKVINK